jgi:hypothetical protein
MLTLISSKPTKQVVHKVFIDPRSHMTPFVHIIPKFKKKNTKS